MQRSYTFYFSFTVPKMLTRSVSKLVDRIGSDVIGIDLGTTNSAVAVFKRGANGAAGAPEILKNSEGIIYLFSFLCCTTPVKIQHSDEPLTPSCVSFSSDATKPLVGESAVSKKISDYEHTIYGEIKQLL